jgi:hypothetical protein
MLYGDPLGTLNRQDSSLTEYRELTKPLATYRGHNHHNNNSSSSTVTATMISSRGRPNRQ